MKDTILTIYSETHITMQGEPCVMVECTIDTLQGHQTKLICMPQSTWQKEKEKMLVSAKA